MYCTHAILFVSSPQETGDVRRACSAEDSTAGRRVYVYVDVECDGDSESPTWVFQSERLEQCSAFMAAVGKAIARCRMSPAARAKHDATGSEKVRTA